MFQYNSKIIPMVALESIIKLGHMSFKMRRNYLISNISSKIYTNGEFPGSPNG